MPLNQPKFNPLEYEQVTYHRKRKKMKVPKYRAISLAGTYATSGFTTDTSVDMLDTLSKCSSMKSIQFFNQIHLVYDYSTGLSVITTQNQTERNQVSRAYKELNSLGLVKRVKRSHYIINPRMYLNFELFDSLCLLWDSL